jgi:hypothetical protein
MGRKKDKKRRKVERDKEKVLEEDRAYSQTELEEDF